MSVVNWVDLADRVRQRRTDVHVRVHWAILLEPGRPVCFFINVYNASPQLDVTITHVWLATDPPVHVLTKSLPRTLAPRTEWETWVEVKDVPFNAMDDVEYLARVKLAGDRVLHSEPRENVPAAGHVPDG